MKIQKIIFSLVISLLRAEDCINNGDDDCEEGTVCANTFNQDGEATGSNICYETENCNKVSRDFSIGEDLVTILCYSWLDGREALDVINEAIVDHNRILCDTDWDCRDEPDEDRCATTVTIIDGEEQESSDREDDPTTRKCRSEDFCGIEEETYIEGTTIRYDCI